MEHRSNISGTELLVEDTPQFVELFISLDLMLRIIVLPLISVVLVIINFKHRLLFFLLTPVEVLMVERVNILLEVDDAQPEEDNNAHL